MTSGARTQMRGFTASKIERIQKIVSNSFLAYAVVSVSALIVELCVLHMTLALGAHSIIAISCGYLSSSIFQFTVLRYVVFRVTHRPVLLQVNAYLAAAVASWWTVVGVVTILMALFHLTAMEARVISIPALFPLNYLVSRYFIFRK